LAEPLEIERTRESKPMVPSAPRDHGNDGVDKDLAWGCGVAQARGFDDRSSEEVIAGVDDVAEADTHAKRHPRMSPR
jgi:hypothetical protein